MTDNIIWCIFNFAKIQFIYFVAAYASGIITKKPGQVQLQDAFTLSPESLMGFSSDPF